MNTVMGQSIYPPQAEREGESTSYLMIESVCEENSKNSSHKEIQGEQRYKIQGEQRI